MSSERERISEGRGSFRWLPSKALLPKKKPTKGKPITTRLIIFLVILFVCGSMTRDGLEVEAHCHFSVFLTSDPMMTP
jgi:hypothetical protein